MGNKRHKKPATVNTDYGALFLAQKGCCFSCGVSMKPNEAQRQYLIDGGNASWKDNIVLVHLHCLVNAKVEANTSPISKNREKEFTLLKFAYSTWFKKRQEFKHKKRRRLGLWIK